MKKVLFAALAAAVLAGAGAIAAGAPCWADDKTAKDKPETATIRWARGTSGNGLVTVAKRLGYFKEYGLDVVEINMEDDSGTALVAGTIDVVSNNGTNDPLSAIAAGNDIIIFGGHMLTGCMPIIAQKDTEWKGIESFIGKKIACPPDQFALTGALLKLGHDPLKEAEWMVLPTQSDRVAAVVSGEADFGVIGTGQMYSILNMPNIKIVNFMSDITPNYSCCRLYTRTNFLKENPTTFKLLMKAQLRAQAYYEKNKKEVVKWMAEEIGANEDYVASYMLNEHYRINADPIKDRVIDAWNVLDKTGFLSENAKNIKITDHIDTALYKAALDELMADEKIYSQDKEFYDRQLKFFEENNH
ncbi:ABC transporter substrate-binding protein [Cloacibacillus sp. An23]|uniref:ABC transporter substrate-binding protein n=1 Tax=Cloacibacillus sp. An23 TaxID=1965591 RepID=UPI000B39E9C9|nr:ABC transporter substrate-binding protein [Cloacibacillus sp. An23]OUO95122.1 hypothetical protein B5F39_00915 [Cloacibacillus sp. An23]